MNTIRRHGINRSRNASLPGEFISVLKTYVKFSNREVDIDVYRSIIC